MPRTRVTALALALALALTLAGCTRAEDGAAPTPSATRSTPPVKAPAASSRPLDGDAHVPSPRGIDERNATAVALAWAELSYGYDTVYDAHPHAATLRAARYLTREKAALEKSYSPAAGPGAQWNTWAGHRAWTEANATLIDADEEARTDESTRALRVVSVDGKAHGRDGWKGPGPRLHAYLTLTNPGKSAPWRVHEISIIEAASTPTRRP
ncbi:hypothetical protein ABCR94_03555 [Streptomyces sp. 21So2-11]|uniref:hypothetical protein n=1 Tax=Streptomyces sp. 21So2-11 TaxID=3144408 RepID=UPI003218F5D9